MKTAVVTGATSMLGVATIEELLRQKVKVYAIVRPHSKKLDRLPVCANLCVTECPLGEIEALTSLIPSRCDVFYHFGWEATEPDKRNTDFSAQCRNISGALAALNTAKKLGCRTFIGAGSQSEYGNLDIEKISPDSPVHPVQPYAIAKYAAGRMCMEAAKPMEMICIWVRVFSVYGRYDKPETMVTSTVRKLKRGEPCCFTEARQRWDYLNEADAGRAFYLIGEKCKESKVYCLGSGSARPLKEYIEIIRDCVSPSAVLHFGAIPYTSYSVMNICADISSLTADTGFLPEISFAQGIQSLSALP